MKKQVQSRQHQKTKKTKKPTWTFTLDNENLKYLAIGFAVIVLGYILMATGITEESALPSGKWNNPFTVYVAPILLVLGYCVIIPYALLKTFKKDKES
ncbi:MAG: DUF3098 domain-containing protein [Candidatus Kapaibacteriota bacterium]